MFSEKITFPVGILVGKTVFTQAVLEEEVFGHTLRASGLPGVDTGRLDDAPYFTLARLAVRLKVPGLFEARLQHDAEFKEWVEEYAENHDLKVKQVTAAMVHPVSVETVDRLHRIDGRLLLAASAVLEDRRSEFRKEALALQDGDSGAHEDGLHGKGRTSEESGGD